MNQITENKIITLNSASAILNNGTLLSNVLFNTGCILDDINDAYISVIDAQIPVSFYTVNSTNNTFKVSINNGSYITYTIPIGNYNNYTLISALQLLLPSFTFTFNSINGVLTISSTNLIFSLDLTTSIFNTLLGFNNLIYNITSGTIIASYPLNLLGVKRISIKSYNLGVSNFNSTGGDIVLATIPCDQPPFNMLSYTNQNAFKQIIHVKSINSIDILITDEANTLLDFNNIHWSLTLSIEFKRFKPDLTSTFKEIINEGLSADTLENNLGNGDKDLGNSKENILENKDLEELDFLNE